MIITLSSGFRYYQVGHLSKRKRGKKKNYITKIDMVSDLAQNSPLKVNILTLISYRVRSHLLVERFSTEAQMGLSYTVEKGIFRLTFFRLSFPTAQIQSKSVSRKTQPKKFTPVFEPIAYRSSHHKTHHTPVKDLVGY